MVNYVAASKILGYGLLGPPQNAVNASKIVGYALLGPPQTAISVSKFLGYAVLGPSQNAIVVSKLVGYAILQPVPLWRLQQEQPRPRVAKRSQGLGRSYGTNPNLFPPAVAALTYAYSKSKPYWMRQRVTHARPRYTVKKFTITFANPDFIIPFVRAKPSWMRYDTRHHSPRYSVHRSAIVQPALVMVPPHRKTRPWELSRKHKRPRYTTVRLYPWSPARIGVDYLVREVLKSGDTTIRGGVTYLVREVLAGLSPLIRINQTIREVLKAVNTTIEISDVVRESQIAQTPGAVHMTSTVREASIAADALVHITSTAREKLIATKPFPNPDQQSEAQNTPMLVSASFGDGYTQRAPVSTSNVRRRQTVQWANLPQAQARRILYFLERMGGHYPFMWLPNGEDVPKWFVASSWKVKELSRGYTTIYDCILEEASKEHVHNYNYSPPWLPEAYH